VGQFPITRLDAPLSQAYDLMVKSRLTRKPEMWSPGTTNRDLASLSARFTMRFVALPTLLAFHEPMLNHHAGCDTYGRSDTEAHK